MTLPLDKEEVEPGFHRDPAGSAPAVRYGGAEFAPLPGEPPRER